MPPKLSRSDGQCSLRRQRKEFLLSGIFFASQKAAVPVTVFGFILFQGVCSGRGIEKGREETFAHVDGREMH